MSLNWTPLQRRLALHDRFKAALGAAMGERGMRSEWVEAPSGPVLAWQLYELGVMHDQVNKVRASLGLPAVSLDVVASAERQAAGHVDYHSKFAVYCTQIVLDEWTVTGC